jgi:Cell wall-active antibiotics response 4TMS YvqF
VVKPPKPPKPRSALVPVTFSLLAILAGVVVLFGVDVVTGLALALFLVAAAMLVGAWRGRARGLIPIAILLSGALLVASLIDVPFKGGAGDRLFRPTTVAQLESPYRLVAGELRLDLSNFRADGRTVPVVATMATGVIVVTVPAGMAVDVDADVGAGSLLVFGREWEGLGIDERVSRPGTEGAGRLELDVKVGLGELEVRRAAA